MLLNINWNWILSPMTFLMSLQSVFNSTIGLNILEKSYKVLWGLGIIIDDNIFKCVGQWPKFIYALTILIKLLRYKLLLTITFRCFQDNLSSLGVNELLHLMIELLNFSLENSVHFIMDLFDSFVSSWKMNKELAKDYQAPDKINYYTELF